MYPVIIGAVLTTLCGVSAGYLLPDAGWQVMVPIYLAASVAFLMPWKQARRSAFDFIRLWFIELMLTNIAVFIVYMVMLRAGVQ